MKATFFTGINQKGWLELEFPSNNDTIKNVALAVLEPLGWILSSRQCMWEANKFIKHADFVRKELNRHPWNHGEIIKIQRELRSALEPLGVKVFVETSNGLE